MPKEGAEKKVVEKEEVIKTTGTDSFSALLEEDAKRYVVRHPDEGPEPEPEPEP
jgi:hypothetical protein